MVKATESAAKMKGAAKALAGYPGVFHHWTGEHGDLATLLSKIEQADGKKCDEIFSELRWNLRADELTYRTTAGAAATE